MIITCPAAKGNGLIAARTGKHIVPITADSRLDLAVNKIKRNTRISGNDSRVVPQPAPDHRVLSIDEQRVITSAAPNSVGTRIAADHIVASTAGQGIISVTAHDRQAALLRLAMNIISAVIPIGPVKSAIVQIRIRRSLVGKAQILNRARILDFHGKAVFRFTRAPTLIHIGQADIAHAPGDGCAIPHIRGKTIQRISENTQVPFRVIIGRTIIIGQVDLGDPHLVQRQQLAIIHHAVLIGVLKYLHRRPHGIKRCQQAIAIGIKDQIAIRIPRLGQRLQIGHAARAPKRKGNLAALVDHPVATIANRAIRVQIDDQEPVIRRRPAVLLQKPVAVPVKAHLTARGNFHPVTVQVEDDGEGAGGLVGADDRAAGVGIAGSGVSQIAVLGGIRIRIAPGAIGAAAGIVVEVVVGLAVAIRIGERTAGPIRNRPAPAAGVELR